MIETLTQLPLFVYLLIGIGLFYLLLNIIFPKKNKIDEEIKQQQIKNSKKKKINYSQTTYSSIREPSNDHILPTDGTSIHQKGMSGLKKNDKKKNVQETLSRLPKYEYLLNEKRETNLNHLARELEIINDQVITDLKYFKKKKHLFLNVNADIITCTVSYSDDYEPIIDDTDNNIDNEVDYTDEESIDSDGNIKCKCPKCGTINTISINEKEYRCFYCLNKIKR